MANVQLRPTRPSRLRRFFAWFGRHKVTAVFAVLFTTGALYLFGSWVVLQVQIHFERDRFVKLQSDVKKIDNQLQNQIADDDMQLDQYCYYESSTNEFVRGPRFCVVRLSITAGDLDKELAVTHLSNVKAILEKGSTLRPLSPQDSYSLNDYAFEDQNVNCSLSSEFYTADISEFTRAQRAPKTGNSFLIDLICSGPAKAEYFPVLD